ncbi:MAG: LysE family transporter [Cyanobacteria bacterium P01_D01_bin.1]
MLLGVLLKGMVMGLAIAAPVGPIGLLCIRRTLDKGRLVGLLSGCGAATADGLYGMVAAFGLTAVSDFLVEYSDWLRIGGGLFLCYLGITTFFSGNSLPSFSGNSLPRNDLSELPSARLESNPPCPPSTPHSSYSTLRERRGRTRKAKPYILPRSSFLSAYTSTLALTLTNPATVLSFLAIFAGLGITQSAYLDSVTLVFGVFTGSILWWVMLVSGVAYLRDRLTPERLFRFNRFSSKVFGMLIFGFGVTALTIAI